MREHDSAATFIDELLDDVPLELADPTGTVAPVLERAAAHVERPDMVAWQLPRLPGRDVIRSRRRRSTAGGAR